MSNPHLMLSLAGIAGGFGRGPATRAPTGVAKERIHLRNIPEWEREGAKAEYQQIVEKAKADRAAAIAEWFNRYPAAMPVEYRKIDKVVAAFLVGRGAEAPNSGVSTDGGALNVQGNTVAMRRSAGDRFITVCPGLFGESKASRYAANSALRLLGAGIRVSDITRGKGDEGFAFFTPSRSPKQGRILVADRCVQVEVNKATREKALQAVYGSDMIGPVQQEAREGLEEPGRREASSRRYEGRTYGPGKYMRTSKKTRAKARRKSKK